MDQPCGALFSTGCANPTNEASRMLVSCMTDACRAKQLVGVAWTDGISSRDRLSRPGLELDLPSQARYVASGWMTCDDLRPPRQAPMPRQRSRGAMFGIYQGPKARRPLSQFFGAHSWSNCARCLPCAGGGTNISRTSPSTASGCSPRVAARDATRRTPQALPFPSGLCHTARLATRWAPRPRWSTAS